MLGQARRVGAEATALAGMAHAMIWLLGGVSATLAGLHLGGVLHIDRHGIAAGRQLALAVPPKPASFKEGPAPIPLSTAAPPVIPVAAVAPPSSAASAPATLVMGAPAPATVLHGLDVSKWNGNWVDHLDGALAGISFVFVRASDGLTADSSFDRHWNAVRRNGLVRGSYHFYRVEIDPEQQVQTYLRMLGVPEQGDITPVLDFEEQSFPPSAPPAKHKVQADLLRALEALERHGGRVPMIYTNWDTGRQWLDDPRFARYPLWIADWTQRHAPRLPPTWAAQGFRFWQRTDHYEPPGANKLAMDLDWFVGRREDLAR